MDESAQPFQPTSDQKLDQSYHDGCSTVKMSAMVNGKKMQKDG